MDPNNLNQSILQNIFYHLPPWDMRSVAGVCHQWREVARDVNFIRGYCQNASTPLKGIVGAQMILARPWEFLKAQSSLSFSHSYQGRVAVWNGRFAGQFLYTITVKSYLSNEVLHLPFPNGHSLVDIQYAQGALVVASETVVSREGTVTIYQGKALDDVTTHSGLPAVNAVKLQGKRLVWGTQRGVTLLDGDARKDKAWKTPVTAVTSDPAYAFFGDLDGRVMKWGDDDAELVCHTSKVMALDVSHGVLVSGSFDHTVCVIDTATFTVKHKLFEHTHAVMSVCVYRNLCVTGSLDETVRVWDLDAHYLTMNPRKRSRVPRAALIQTLRTDKPVCKVDFCGSLLVASSGYAYPEIYDFTPWETPPAQPLQFLPFPPGHPGVLSSTV